MKNKKILIIISVITLISFIIGFSYAYFTTDIVVNEHKYCLVEDYTITNNLNRNRDFKNEDCITNISITESYLKNININYYDLKNRVTILIYRMII